MAGADERPPRPVASHWLAAWAFGTGYFAMAIVLVRLTYLYGPSDQAYGLGPLVLLDPFVLTVAVPIAVIPSAVGMVVAGWALQPTDQRVSLPIVAAATLAAAWFSAPLHMAAAVPVSLAALLAMLACRWQALGRFQLGRGMPHA